MGKVVPMPVSLSDRGKALCAIEAERQGLYEKARQIAKDQQVIMEAAVTNVTELGKQHEIILAKLAALDDTANKIVEMPK